MKQDVDLRRSKGSWFCPALPREARKEGHPHFVCGSRVRHPSATVCSSNKLSRAHLQARNRATSRPVQ